MNYFKEEEFDCSCGCGGGHADMAPQLLRKLVAARSMSPVPFTLTSAFRCQEHNKSIGSKSTSSHTNGTAVDIKAINGSDRYQILMALVGAGFNRVGVSKGFIHADVDRDKVGGVCWVY
ncbi:D-Ala-D-Ala carboxypeptidase family metallohydrolase [bacterium]|nr:D-Ala-D-Ala carboxypeptidase family metallohydrolase [bacterium]